MKVKDRAKELIEKYSSLGDGFASLNSEQCASICVDEIIKEAQYWARVWKEEDQERIKHWKEVKQIIMQKFRINHEERDCPECEGTGRFNATDCCNAPFYRDTDICSLCKEHASDTECEECGGVGERQLTTEEQLTNYEIEAEDAYDESKGN